MKLTRYKRERLEEALGWCEDNYKSTEYTIQYMQDFAKADLGQVLYYIEHRYD